MKKLAPSDKEKLITATLEEIAKDLNASYINMVNDYATKSSEIPFENSSIDHARYITAKMLTIAKENVYILSGTLNEVYFKKIREILKLVAKDIKSVKVITLEETNDENVLELANFFKELNKDVGDNVFQYLPLQNNGDPKKFSHFYIIDGKAWRKESPHDRDIADANDIHAEVCFNNPKKANKLQTKFQNFWDQFASKDTILGTT